MGTLVGVIGGSYSGLLLAKGMARTNSILIGFQVAVQISAVLIGNYFMGEKGVILGMAFSSWLLYPVQAFVHSRIDLWEAKLDLPFVLMSFFVVYLNIDKVVSYG